MANRDLLDRARERPFAFAVALLAMLIIEVGAQAFGVQMLSAWLRNRHGTQGGIALVNGPR